MGINQSKAQREERKRQKALNKQLQKDQAFEAKVKKLLLLGAGESGKSTLFKQMIDLYGQGYSEHDRKMLKKTVYSNTRAAMLTLVQQTEILSEKNKEEWGDCKIRSKSGKKAAHWFKQHVAEHKNDCIINHQVAKYMKALWKDAGVKRAYDLRAKFQLIDTAKYFFDKLDELAEPDYIPSFDDVLRTRVRTTGIVETEFDIEGRIYRMFDVGGQRNERKKWIHCFEDCTAVIFVVAISAYDQVLFEDDTTNRIQEALTLFDEICNSHWFQDTSMILFLNKRDLFDEKIQVVPLTEGFPEYTGDPHSYEECTEYIKQVFESKNIAGDASKKVYTHITCATDQNNIQHVFHAVRDIIINKSLQKGGLLE